MTAPDRGRARRRPSASSTRARSSMNHGTLEGLAACVVGRLALARVVAARDRHELGGVRLRHEGRDEASGDVGRTSTTQAPTFDPDGKYLYFVSDRNVRAGLRRLRQQLDLPEPDAARRRAAARGRPLAACAAATTWRTARRTTRARRARKARRARGKRDEQGKGEKGEEGRQARRTSSQAAGARDDRPRGLRGARGGAAAGGGQLRRAGRGERQAALPAACRAPARASEKAALVYFDFDEREEKTVLEDVDAFDVTADGKKALVARKDSSPSSTSRKNRNSRSRCGPARWS